MFEVWLFLPAELKFDINLQLLNAKDVYKNKIMICRVMKYSVYVMFIIITGINMLSINLIPSKLYYRFFSWHVCIIFNKDHSSPLMEPMFLSSPNDCCWPLTIILTTRASNLVLPATLLGNMASHCFHRIWPSKTSVSIQSSFHSRFFFLSNFLRVYMEHCLHR